MHENHPLKNLTSTYTQAKIHQRKLLKNIDFGAKMVLELHFFMKNYKSFLMADIGLF